MYSISATPPSREGRRRRALLSRPMRRRSTSIVTTELPFSVRLDPEGTTTVRPITWQRGPRGDGVASTAFASADADCDNGAAYRGTRRRRRGEGTAAHGIGEGLSGERCAGGKPKDAVVQTFCRPLDSLDVDTDTFDS